MLTRDSLLLPRLPPSNARELAQEGFSQLGVLAPEEVALALSILQRHVSALIPTSGEADILCPKFASSDSGANLRRDKALRILTQELASEFMALDGIRRLRVYFKGFTLANVTYGERIIERRDEVYFRVVRPNEASDVGPLHRDQWFNEIYTPDSAHLSSFKVWIALNCPPGSELQFVPLAMDEAWTYEVIDTPNGPRPRGKVPATVSVLQPRLRAGDALIFDPFTLHKGAINPGPENRVSVELCFMESRDWLS